MSNPAFVSFAGLALAMGVTTDELDPLWNRIQEDDIPDSPREVVSLMQGHINDLRSV